MKKISILFMLALLTSCGGRDFEVLSRDYCVEEKVKYICKTSDWGSSILAQCDTKEECEEKCNEHRRNYSDGKVRY